MNPNQSEALEVAQAAPAQLAVSPINILERAISGGVTQENVSVVKELIAMCREQRADDAKAAFARAFFQLRKNMPELYADKAAMNRNNEVAYTYCSEAEISKMIDYIDWVSTGGGAMLDYLAGEKMPGLEGIVK